MRERRRNRGLSKDAFVMITSMLSIVICVLIFRWLYVVKDMERTAAFGLSLAISLGLSAIVAELWAKGK